MLCWKPLHEATRYIRPPQSSVAEDGDSEFFGSVHRDGSPLALRCECKTSTTDAGTVNDVRMCLGT